MALPFIKSDNPQMDLLQTRWSSELNPLLGKPLSSANILKGVSLVNGVNTVNHLLGRQMQGWIIVDVDAAATIYRSQPMNDKTLTLTSNANCNVILAVF